MDCEVREAIMIYRLKHGFAGKHKHPLYSIWENMKKRCNNKNNRCYKLYGGRGIKVCKRWNKFIHFKDDMLDSYKKGLKLERLDNNKGYSKVNCKWATSAEQARNQRSNVLITINGVTKIAADWATDKGINRYTLYKRIYRGMNPILAVLTPIKK